MKKLYLNKFISMALAVIITLTMTTVISGCSSKASEVKDKSEVSTSSTSASETVKDDENKDEQNSDTTSSQEQEEKSEENKDTQKAKDESQSSNTQSTASSSQQNQSSNTNKSTSSNSSTSTNKNSSTSSKPQSTASQSSSHTHKWTEHKAKRWHENIVTVVDQPEQYKEYTLYRMYWYNTGKWEETRDPDRFNEWNHDMNGGPLSPNSINMASKPENCPLFKGYNDLGQPTYTNDHSIISGLYDTIPEVTHEEDQGWYEEYVDYVWCPECGAKK